AIVLAGCEAMSKPYITETPRVDQVVDAGNRGYLLGNPPPAKDRSNLKRPWITMDVDLLEGKDGKVVLDSKKSIIEPRVGSETGNDAPRGYVKESAPVRRETIATIRSEVTVTEEEVK
ncbi:MAG: hypothetical protein PHT32_06010, partial [Candidatus Omnitrophica bacterium]|nr:hypothetical protein [Candidatus Omnitrophota bacterium]